MTKLSSYAEKRLRKAGWYPGRDVSRNFRFCRLHRLFPASVEIYREFGYLTLYRNEEEEKGHKPILMMDIDDSENSITMRKKDWELPCDEKISYPVTLKTFIGEETLEKNEVEATDFDQLYFAELYLSQPCARLCQMDSLRLLDESYSEWESGIGLYLSKNGFVFLVTDYPVWIANSFIEFLNKILREPI